MGPLFYLPHSLLDLSTYFILHSVLSLITDFFMAPLPKEIVTLHEVRLFLSFTLVDLAPPAGSDHGKAQ